MPLYLKIALPLAGLILCVFAVRADQLLPNTMYRALPTLPFDTIKANDEADKAEVARRQRAVLEQRYDLSDRPIPNVMMSGGRKSVQGGVRVKLPPGVTRDQLVAMSTR